MHQNLPFLQSVLVDLYAHNKMTPELRCAFEVASVPCCLPHSSLPPQPLPHQLTEPLKPLQPPAPDGPTAKQRQEIVFRVKELIQ